MSKELSKELVNEAAAAPKGVSVSIETEFKKIENQMVSLFRKLEDNIDKKIDAMDIKFTKMFGEVKAEIGGLKSEIQANTSDIESVSEKMGEFEKSLNYESDRITDAEKKHMSDIKKTEETLDEKVKLLDQKLLLLEKQDRKYNLLFCGIPEVPDERLYDKMRRFFVTDLKTAQERAQIIHFVNGHRYPTKGDGPKPIIIRFSSFDDRELVLSQAKNLLKAKKRILTDLPVPMNIERDRIAKIAYKIRRQEEIQTRIKEKGLDLYLEVRNRKTDPWVRREIDEDDSGAVKD